MMSRNFTPEQTLIDKLLVDDAAAFEELCRRYCFSLFNYCMTKLHSKEDATRIVRNIFISLWEDRHMLPVDFSLSLHLYTEVRKAVIQCLNNKLNRDRDTLRIGEEIIPGFSAIELRKAKLPVQLSANNRLNIQDRSGLKSYEEQWWNKYTPSINLKDLTHVFKNMLNAW
ncbi:MAG: hypothetical protein H7Y42_17690 [Chitinophagaceae bacterium]|nr:hypothetical protein [Chitinophagaceae bacterium]